MSNTNVRATQLNFKCRNEFSQNMSSGEPTEFCNNLSYVGRAEFFRELSFALIEGNDQDRLELHGKVKKSLEGDLDACEKRLRGSKKNKIKETLSDYLYLMTVYRIFGK